LSAAHVALFTDQEKTHWSYSFLSPFLDNPYDRLPAEMVGTATSGDTATFANASYLGDGYANLGYAGVFLEAFVLLVLLVLVNRATAGLPLAVSTSLIIAPSMILANVSPLTTVLSGGLGAALVVGWFLPRTGWEPALRPRLARLRPAHRPPTQGPGRHVRPTGDQRVNSDRVPGVVAERRGDGDGEGHP